MKFWIQTFGCQMNVADSERMSRLLANAGHEPCADHEEAEIILLNTCTIRDNADQRVYGRVGQFKQLKDQGRLRILGVCGCLAQSDGQSLIDRSPHLDFVVGTRAYQDIPALIERIEAGETHHVRTEMASLPDDIWDRTDMAPNLDAPIEYPAFVTIMRGCNKQCTYCIVPFVRGREEYRPVDSILREVRNRVAAGYREVTLVGQNVNCYKDTNPQSEIRNPKSTDFASLLRQVGGVPGLRRLRFATNHPRHFDSAIIRAMAETGAVCEHVHLPVQSGSDKVLKDMRRSYRIDRYLATVAELRQAMPAISITTDVIVGFPGETDEDFERTLDLAREVRWDGAFMFCYSSRRGTRAAELENPVPEDVANERLQRLIELQNRISEENNQSFIGRTVEVMVERVSESVAASPGLHAEEPGAKAPDARAGAETLQAPLPRVQARTRCNRVVILDQREDAPWKPGDFAEVEIAGAKPFTLFGKTEAAVAP